MGVRWPSGHFAWAFSDVTEFAGGATTFLAEGLALEQKSMYVADDPRPDLWPAHLLASGALVIASTSEIYGGGVRFVPAEQRATYASALADALQQGYSGLRVAADNSRLVCDPERIEAWLEWEDLAEEFIAEAPVTGMCGFDRTRVNGGVLRTLMRVHRRSVTARSGESGEHV